MRFCVEHGIRGFDWIGVNPVPKKEKNAIVKIKYFYKEKFNLPPSIKESKLNIPDDGVTTFTPAISATFFFANASEGKIFKLGGTFSDDGRFGFEIIRFLQFPIKVGVFNWGMYGVVGVVISNCAPDSLK